MLIVEEFGIDPNVTCEDKVTSLHITAEKGHSYSLTFGYLMEKAAVKNPQDKYGYTPLHWAAKAGHMEIFKIILSNAKEMNPTSYLRTTPISIAAENRNISLCFCLTCETLKSKLASLSI